MLLFTKWNDVPILMEFLGRSPSHPITSYFFQGSFVPISVNAENTKYIISRPVLTRKITTSLFIGKVVKLLVVSPNLSIFERKDNSPGAIAHVQGRKQ
jgi:hypothetical protein